MNRKKILGFMVFLTLLVCSSHASEQWVPRLIPAWVSIGNMDRPAIDAPCAQGTLGCMLWRIWLVDDGVPYYECHLWGLTNRHVLDPGEGTAQVTTWRGNHSELGDNIVQPGPQKPSCTQYPSNVVGRLYQLVDIDAHKNGYRTANKVDACIFVSAVDPNNGEFLLRWDGYVHGIGLIDHFMATATVGMDVAKSGMSTNVTYSNVVSTYEDYHMPWNNKTATFVDQLAIELPFCAEGDSGSLVVARASKAPVGLLTGIRIYPTDDGNFEDFAVANKIQNVMAALPGFVIAGAAPWPRSPEALASDHPGAWMRDGNPRFEEIKKIQDRFSEYLKDRLKPIKELVSLGTRADDQGEPYFLVAINYKRKEVIEEKGLPEVWEGIPVKYELSTEYRFK